MNTKQVILSEIDRRIAGNDDAQARTLASLRRFVEALPDDYNETFSVRHYRKPVTERLNDIRCSIAKAKDGFDPFSSRSRDKVKVCWRQCIWRKLTKEGYHSVEIAKATGYDHATIWYSMQRLDDYLYSGDPLAVETWKDLLNIIELPRFYGD